MVAVGHAAEQGVAMKIVSSEVMARIDGRSRTEFAYPSRKTPA